MSCTLSDWGSIASLIALGGSFFSAIWSWKSANKAKLYKEQIENRIAVTGFAIICHETEGIIAGISSIGLSGSSTTVRGIQIQPIIDKLSSYILLLQRESSKIVDNKELIARLIDRITPHIRCLSGARSAKSRLEIGKTIYNILSEFYASIKEIEMQKLKN